jgi:hypothetical protein
MKTQISNALKFFCLSSFILLAAFICATGCAGLVHHSDPLAGWRLCSSDELNKIILTDYQDYIAKLSDDKKNISAQFSFLRMGQENTP